METGKSNKKELVLCWNQAACKETKEEVFGSTVGICEFTTNVLRSNKYPAEVLLKMKPSKFWDLCEAEFREFGYIFTQDIHEYDTRALMARIRRYIRYWLSDRNLENCKRYSDRFEYVVREMLTPAEIADLWLKPGVRICYDKCMPWWTEAMIFLLRITKPVEVTIHLLDKLMAAEDINTVRRITNILRYVIYFNESKLRERSETFLPYVNKLLYFYRETNVYDALWLFNEIRNFDQYEYACLSGVIVDDYSDMIPTKIQSMSFTNNVRRGRGTPDEYEKIIKNKSTWQRGFGFNKYLGSRSRLVKNL